MVSVRVTVRVRVRVGRELGSCSACLVFHLSAWVHLVQLDPHFLGVFFYRFELGL